jgi:hypothetical protein
MTTPLKTPQANHNSQTDVDNKVVGSAKTPPQVKTHPGGKSVARIMPVTPRESEALIQQIEGNNHEATHEGTLMDRLSKVERQIHQLTLMVAAFMTLTIALVAFLTFLGVKDNLISWSAVQPPKKISAISNPLSPEAKAPSNYHQSPSPAPAASTPPSASSETRTPTNEGQPPIADEAVLSNEPQSAAKTALPAGNNGPSSETATLPAVPEPAPKFVGSITSNKIHYPDCKWAKTIKPERLITFPSIAAARAQGYIPCPVCRPHESDETH